MKYQLTICTESEEDIQTIISAKRHKQAIDDLYSCVFEMKIKKPEFHFEKAIHEKIWEEINLYFIERGV